VLIPHIHEEEVSPPLSPQIRATCSHLSMKQDDNDNNVFDNGSCHSGDTELAPFSFSMFPSVIDRRAQGSDTCGKRWFSHLTAVRDINVDTETLSRLRMDWNNAYGSIGERGAEHYATENCMFLVEKDQMLNSDRETASRDGGEDHPSGMHIEAALQRGTGLTRHARSSTVETGLGEIWQPSRTSPTDDIRVLERRTGASFCRLMMAAMVEKKEKKME
jgi:hypothetical protein